VLKDYISIDLMRDLTLKIVFCLPCNLCDLIRPVDYCLYVIITTSHIRFYYETYINAT
jgi:hypothetical protein